MSDLSALADALHAVRDDDEHGLTAETCHYCWDLAGRLLATPQVTDMLATRQRDLAAKVEALLADSAKWHTKGVEVIPKQRIRNLLADALPQDADSEPASETRDGGAGL